MHCLWMAMKTLFDKNRKDFDMLADISYIAVAIAAFTSLIALILNIIKTCLKSQPTPFRRRLEYSNKFGDFISNLGLGPMIIKSIRFLYNKEEDKSSSLVELYSKKLDKSFICSTYFKNSEIVNRWIAPKDDLKLIELNPQDNDLDLDKLNKEREKITIIIKYKSMFWPFCKTMYL